MAPPQPLKHFRLPLACAGVVCAGLCLTSIDARANVEDLKLGVSTSTYLGRGTSSRQSQYSSLGADLKLAGDGKELSADFHVLGLLSFNDSDYRFIEAPEAWIGNSPKRFAPVQFSLGRRLNEWSKLDSEWGLGLWQPRFRWDYLRPENVGLVGAHLSVKTKFVQAWAMASPIFVPDRGAPLDFADGRVQSLSPWSINPAYTAEIFEKDTEIRYDARIPSVSSVIGNPNASARLRIGQERGPWFSASYAYKPMNQLLMSYDAVLVTTATESYVNATIYPRVSYHHVAAVDAGFTGSNFEAWLSWLGDRPKDSAPAGPLRTSQVVDRAMLLSPSFSYWFSGSRKSKAGGKATVSYLRKFGNDPADEGRFAQGSSSFDSRYPYQNALIVSARSPQWEGFTADLKVLYDLSHPGSIVSWLVEYAPADRWSLYASSDILTSWTPEGSDDFIHRYRANDRFTGGVTYVF